MCSPTLAVTTALTVASTAVSYQQQTKQAEAQAEYMQQSQQNSYTALNEQYEDIGAREQQEQASASQDRDKIERERRAKMATARVASGEAGILGNSIDLGLRDISGAAARDTSTVNTNLDWTLQSMQRQKKSAATQTQSQINSMQPTQGPSNIATGLELANIGAKTYGQYQANKEST